MSRRGMTEKVSRIKNYFTIQVRAGIGEQDEDEKNFSSSPS